MIGGTVGCVACGDDCRESEATAEQNLYATQAGGLQQGWQEIVSASWVSGARASY